MAGYHHHSPRRFCVTPYAPGSCLSIRDYGWRSLLLFGREISGAYRYTCQCGDRYVRVRAHVPVRLEMEKALSQ